jgi:hypothetical protein
VGIGINRFYCCGKLASVTLIYGAADNTNNHSADKNNCCRNEKQGFKVKDSHFNVISLSLDQPVPAIIPSFARLDDETLTRLLRTQIVYDGNAPPGHPDIPAYTLYCAYRI